MIAIDFCEVIVLRCSLHLGASPESLTTRQAAMSRTKSLALELDTAKLELERLRAENAKLWATETAGANGNGQQELHSEVAQLQELYEQALRDLQAKQEEIKEANSQVELLTSQEARIRELEIEVQREKGTIIRMQEQHKEQQKS